MTIQNLNENSMIVFFDAYHETEAEKAIPEIGARSECLICAASVDDVLTTQEDDLGIRAAFALCDDHMESYTSPGGVLAREIMAALFPRLPAPALARHRLAHQAARIIDVATLKEMYAAPLPEHNTTLRLPTVKACSRCAHARPEEGSAELKCLAQRRGLLGYERHAPDYACSHFHPNDKTGKQILCAHCERLSLDKDGADVCLAFGVRPYRLPGEPRKCKDSGYQFWPVPGFVPELDVELGRTVEDW